MTSQPPQTMDEKLTAEDIFYFRLLAESEMMGDREGKKSSASSGRLSASAAAGSSRSEAEAVAARRLPKVVLAEPVEFENFAHATEDHEVSGDPVL